VAAWEVFSALFVKINNFRCAFFFAIFRMSFFVTFSKVSKSVKILRFLYQYCIFERGKKFTLALFTNFEGKRADETAEQQTNFFYK
jgi:hypothetical protein